MGASPTTIFDFGDWLDMRPHFQFMKRGFSTAIFKGTDCALSCALLASLAINSTGSPPELRSSTLVTFGYTHGFIDKIFEDTVTSYHDYWSTASVRK